MVITSSGNDWEPVLWSIGAADTQITAQRPVKSFTLREVTGTLALQVRRTQSSTPYFPVAIGEAFGLNIVPSMRSGVPTAATYTLCWLRTTAGGNATVSVLVTY